MNSRSRTSRTSWLAAMLIVLFIAALSTSFTVVHTSADGPRDPFAVRVLNPLLYVQDAVLDALDRVKVDPPEQIVIVTLKFPTPTRTPTPINVGNFVWDDLDQDGRQDAGEPGLSGVVVQLWNSAKTQLLDQAVTNASGIYTLVAPTPGQYRVRVVPGGLSDQFSPKNLAGGNDQLDSDVNPSGTSKGFTDIYTFGSNLISITNIDAGILKYRTPTPTRTPTPINVGNFVWDDYDKDGRQDASEPGLGGIVVQLWNSTKTQMLDQEVSSPTGHYALVAPTPGQYRVRVILNGGDKFSPKNLAGGDDQLDSDINPTGTSAGFTDIYVFASNLISITSIDAGVIVDRPPTATRTPTPINIGNFVWNDLDHDGVQDPGEPGLNGIVVQLWNTTRTYMYDQKQTNSSGIYTVVAPVPGDYRIRVLTPTGSTFSPPNQGGDDLKDSDITNSVISSNFGFSGIITIASNVISTTKWDAGIYNVPNTPSYSPTPPPLAQGDTIALYSKKKEKFAFVDTRESPAPDGSITKVKSNAPIKGQFVMGDWNSDGQATPGLFKDGFFWYTNTFSAAATWSSVWVGSYNKPMAVAGRFSSVVTNDCFGVVEADPDTDDDGFSLYYTCQLLHPEPPGGMLDQFLIVELPGPGKYQFVAGDWNNDNIDTIAVRRANTIMWTNDHPSTGLGAFPNSQNFGDPFDGYGDILAGDWDSNGSDSFGLFFKKKGRFFYRDDLLSAQQPHDMQKVTKPLGKKVKPASWRELTEIRDEPDDVLPLPGTPVNGQPPAATGTPLPTTLPTVFFDVPPSPQAVPTETPLPTQETPATAVPAEVTPTVTPTPSYFPTATPSLAPEVDATSAGTDLE